MKIDYAPVPQKGGNPSAREQQIVRDYLMGDATFTQAADAFGKPKGSFNALVSKVAIYWGRMKMIEIKLTDFEDTDAE